MSESWPPLDGNSGGACVPVHPREIHAVMLEMVGAIYDLEAMHGDWTKANELRGWYYKLAAVVGEPEQPDPYAGI